MLILRGGTGVTTSGREVLRDSAETRSSPPPFEEESDTVDEEEAGAVDFFLVGFNFVTFSSSLRRDDVVSPPDESDNVGEHGTADFTVMLAVSLDVGT